MSRNSLYVNDGLYIDDEPFVFMGISEAGYRFKPVYGGHEKVLNAIPEGYTAIKKIHALSACLSIGQHLAYIRKGILQTGRIKRINPKTFELVGGYKLPKEMAFVYETELYQENVQAWHTIHGIMQGKGRKADKCNFGTAAVQDLAL